MNEQRPNRVVGKRLSVLVHDQQRNVNVLQLNLALDAKQP
jgi:K+-transporting ATPase c subunit